MIGPRYNVGNQEITLITDRFPNRIENKRYLGYLLENLLLECKNLLQFKDINAEDVVYEKVDYMKYLFNKNSKLDG